MAEVLVAWDGNQPVPDPDLDTLDTFLDADGAFVWIDLEREEGDVLDRLADRFDLHALAVESTQLHGERAQLTVVENAYFLEFYALIRDGEDARLSEISVFVGAQYVISVRNADLLEIGRARDRLTGNRRTSDPFSPSMVLYVLLDELVDAWFPFVEDLGERIDDLDERLLSGQESDMYRAIHAERRRLMQFWRVLGPQREVLGMLSRHDSGLIDNRVAVYIADVHDHLLRVMDWLDTLRDTLTTLHDVQLAIASNQLNRVMQMLTAASIMLMSASLIAAVYGMNFTHMPELGWMLGYPLSLALMVLTIGLLFTVFRHRGWL